MQAGREEVIRIGVGLAEGGFLGEGEEAVAAAEEVTVVAIGEAEEATGEEEVAEGIVVRRSSAINVKSQGILPISVRKREFNSSSKIGPSTEKYRIQIIKTP